MLILERGEDVEEMWERLGLGQAELRSECGTKIPTRAADRLDFSLYTAWVGAGPPRLNSPTGPHSEQSGASGSGIPMCHPGVSIRLGSSEFLFLLALSSTSTVMSLLLHKVSISVCLSPFPPSSNALSLPL